ncbi:MAG: ATP-binding cassette domain-containing protein, partial [Opitutales bacterium]|nr:ATP-binding cassette domain-containing protein [Opitutales bacterium]
MLELKNLSLSVGSRTLISGASFTIFAGDKVGIIGHNGCGKTTLLRAITGEFEPDAGEIFLKKDARIVCVRQDITDISQKLIDFVLSADKQLTDLRKRLDQNDQDLADIYEQLNAIDGNSADARAASILAGLGFKNDDLTQPLSVFSGGWQVRAALAATLFAPSDMLILDEPTNHLDLESVIWLESFLRASDKALLLVSHEKSFLDEVCNKILDISAGQAQLYTGNYSTFLRTKAEHQQALVRTFESQQRKREHIQEFVDRFRYKATKARQVQSRIKQLDKLEIVDPPVDNYDVRFKFCQPYPEIDRRLIALEHVTAGYGEHVVLRDISLKIDFGEHIAFLGANGNGKSTLAKVIAGRIVPFSGEIVRARKLKVAYFSQQQTDELDINRTAVEMFKVHRPELSDAQTRTILAGFGLIQARALTKIAQLSGGEKTRLLLAIVASQCPHILILDEPTNHLDIEAREALITALQEYAGTVIWISHDFHTLEASCKKFFIIHDSTCERFTGTLEDYKAFLLSSRGGQVKSADKQISAKSAKKSKNPRADKKLARQIDALEKEIHTLSDQRVKLLRQLDENYSVSIYEQYTELCGRLE